MSDRWKKYSDGWQVGVLAVGTAWLITVLVLPHDVEPTDVPAIRLAPADAEAARREAGARSATLDRPEVPDVVRALGGELRAFGKAEAEGKPRAIETARRAVAKLATPALESAAPDVGALEARYALSFAAKMRSFAKTGTQSDELVELGGDVAKTFAANGWVPDEAHVPDDFDVAMQAFYRRRFVALVGQHPTLAEPKIETRARLAFLMNRAGSGLGANSDVATLRYIDEASALDPSYPVAYARGVVLYRMGRFEAAAVAFDTFLKEGTSGPYRMRAANYLRVSVEAATP